SRPRARTGIRSKSHTSLIDKRPGRRLDRDPAVAGESPGERIGRRYGLDDPGIAPTILTHYDRIRCGRDAHHVDMAKEQAANARFPNLQARRSARNRVFNPRLEEQMRPANGRDRVGREHRVDKSCLEHVSIPATDQASPPALEMAPHELVA